MSGVKIKICGIRRPEDVRIVNRFLPDYAGFVFAGSRRRIDGAMAARLKGMLDCRVKAVGVFVNEDPETIFSLAEKGVIDLVQLHGDEDAGYLEAVKKGTGLPLIKAVRVRGAADAGAAKALAADYLLFDTYSGKEYGGSGKVFDWSVLSGIGRPYFLAGGLCAGNVSDALRAAPYALDVSSGVETDGFKDERKVEEFIRAVRTGE